MKTSENGKTLIQTFEGLKLNKYKDVSGIETIGYGHTGTNLPDTITKDQAIKYFNKDIQEAEKKVNKYSQYSFTQNKYDALVSFAFNIGNIDRLTANGTRTNSEIATNMLLYTYAGGKEDANLQARRRKEYDLFCRNVIDVEKYIYSKDKNLNLSRNFQVKEFIANGSPLRTMYETGKYIELLISHKLVNFLQEIRDYYNKPIIISSGYRPEAYNKSVNGATSSYHIKGMAADIRITGVSPKELAKYAKSIGLNGVGLYKDFVHVDVRDTKYYWNA